MTLQYMYEYFPVMPRQGCHKFTNSDLVTSVASEGGSKGKTDLWYPDSTSRNLWALCEETDESPQSCFELVNNESEHHLWSGIACDGRSINNTEVHFPIWARSTKGYQCTVYQDSVCHLGANGIN